jgi:hypothetical protein
MTASLLITSIYGPSPLNARWHELQRRFIARNTTVGHDFRVALNGVAPSEFPDSEVLFANPANEGHERALGRVVERLRGEPHDWFLILDSDCFPIAPGWHDVLTAQMARFQKSFAAPVRTENLDLFPHPCAVFFGAEALAAGVLDFSKTRPSRNLLGQEVVDVGAAMAEAPFLPLLRTNAINLHPVAAGIYHHLFYHHGAGSRDFAFRVLRKFGYYDHWFDSARGETHQGLLLDELLRDPEGFVETLAGHRLPALRAFLKDGGGAL